MGIIKTRILHVGFPIPYPFYFPGVWGNWEIHFIVPRGFGDQNYFPQGSSGFWGNNIFMTLCILRQKGCKILKWRSNWIIGSVKLIQCKECLGSNIPKFFWTEKLVSFPENKLDFVSKGPRGKVNEDGEFWRDHILIPGVRRTKIREDPWGMRTSKTSLESLLHTVFDYKKRWSKMSSEVLKNYQFLDSDCF